MKLKEIPTWQIVSAIMLLLFLVSLTAVMPPRARSVEERMRDEQRKYEREQREKYRAQREQRKQDEEQNQHIEEWIKKRNQEKWMSDALDALNEEMEKK